MAGVRGFPGRGRRNFLGQFFPLKTYYCVFIYICLFCHMNRSLLTHEQVSIHIYICIHIYIYIYAIHTQIYRHKHTFLVVADAARCICRLQVMLFHVLSWGMRIRQRDWRLHGFLCPLSTAEQSCKPIPHLQRKRPKPEKWNNRRSDLRRRT